VYGLCSVGTKTLGAPVICPFAKTARVGCRNVFVSHVASVRVCVRGYEFMCWGVSVNGGARCVSVCV